MIKKRQYSHENIEICRNCGGTGMAESEGFPSVFSGECAGVCPVCDGSGRVTVTRDVTVTVESFNK